ncbi:Rare lipoprotein A precursor [Fulvivirga imtechensis AK7]|uniref:Probable endolytic peptidoglycan transglycosylase RlpA n=1 Tax=Fulvivirga imtechensis AK7 TaxID=1237149 RepID=L8JTY6_9BACT|nr:septal ring lytic transglycosylase RlpA family protein [Fulvivirga imtechensis]ELR71009.1 Rare lipoprotein A precursor [Fulvivirga imtechensis AK7]
MTLLILGVLSFSLLHAQVQNGQASFYADKFEGRPTASGEKYSHSKLTAAHRSLPFGTMVKVTNLKNNKSVIVRINDRGPFVKGRIIDLSKSAAQKLGFTHQGVTKVNIEVINQAEEMASTDIPEVVEPVGTENNIFFNLEVERTQPNGFGIQIGSFKELGRVLELSENLKRSYQKEVIVQSRWIDGIRNYRVIVGHFKSQERAENFKGEVSKSYPDSFVVEYLKL